MALQFAPTGSASQALAGIGDGLPTLLTTAEAAGLLRLSTHRLRTLRMMGKGPEWVRTGSRRVAYPRAALLRWIEANSSR